MFPDFSMRLAQRDRPPGRPVLAMRWECLLFLHWKCDPAAIQKTLPAGLTVDTFEGAAWLGIVPFFMRRVHPRGLPCVPWLSNFLEFNVRTYVTDRNGVPGVWFYSLLCNQLVAVELARKGFHLNYLHARLGAADETGNTAHFSWGEAGYGPAHFQGREAGGFSSALPESLEFFLVERYVLFSADRRERIHSGRVHHAPYEIAPAVAERWSFRPAASLGLADPGRPPDHALIARPVEVDAWPIRPADAE
jgi:uncharacterized protein YqjF (DUF2071 family)